MSNTLRQLDAVYRSLSPISISSMSSSASASSLPEYNASLPHSYQSASSTSTAVNAPTSSFNDALSQKKGPIAHRTNINGLCLATISHPNGSHDPIKSPYLFVTLLRHTTLTCILNRGAFSVEIPRLKLFTGVLTCANVRYQRNTKQQRTKPTLWTEPRKNFTHVVIIIPNFTTTAECEGIIGKPNECVNVCIWSRNNPPNSSLDEVLESTVSQVMNSLKRPHPTLNESAVPDSSVITEPQPAKSSRYHPPMQANQPLSHIPPMSQNVFNDISNDLNLMSRGPPFPHPPFLCDSIPSYAPYPLASNFNNVGMAPNLAVSQPFFPNAPPPVPVLSAPQQPSFRHVRLQVNMLSKAAGSASTMKSLSSCLLSNILMCIPAFDNILKYLSFRDRLNCRLVCSSWMRIIDSSKAWQEISLNTGDGIPGLCFNASIAAPFFKRCQKLHLYWECNNEVGGLPTSNLQPMLSLCKATIKSLAIHFSWRSIKNSEKSINIPLDIILTTPEKMEKLSISVSCGESSVNLLESASKNSSVTYLTLNGVHNVPKMMQLLLESLPSLQTLHLRSFHMFQQIECLDLQRISEVILDCEGCELQMKSFDWLKNLRRLCHVSIINVVYNDHLLELIRVTSDLPTLSRLTLMELVPKEALASNELVINALPRTLKVFRWDVFLLSVDVNCVDGNLSYSMYTDSHFLRCIIQNRIRNDETEILVTIHETPASRSH